jgi:hypothetical protein
MTNITHWVIKVNFNIFKVTLGSVLESDIRQYYSENRFHYLLEKLQQLPPD